MSEEEFIAYVENNHAVWDRAHRDFKNVEVKEQTWKKIGAAFKMTGADALSYFVSLRQKYVREKTKEKMQGFSNPKKAWHMMPYLRFLDEVITPRKTGRLPSFLHRNDENQIGCFEERLVEQPSTSQLPEASDEDVSIEEPVIDVKWFSPLSQPTLQDPIPDKRRKFVPESDPVTSESTGNVVTTLNNTAEGDWCVKPRVKHFCKYLATRLNNLPDSKVNDFEILVMQKLNELESSL